MNVAIAPVVKSNIVAINALHINKPVWSIKNNKYLLSFYSFKKNTKKLT